MNLNYFLKFLFHKRISVVRIFSLNDIDYSVFELVFFDVDDTLTDDGADLDSKTISFLKSVPSKIVFLSNGHNDRPLLHSLGFQSIFKANKPSPKAFLRTCSKFNVKPKNACIIGDRGIDIATAYFASCPNRFLVKSYGSKASLLLKMVRMIESWKLK